tara:strand:- start:4724 stop:5314 length:591 start_codon:yes stop_codon:yes gene_type:complete
MNSSSVLKLDYAYTPLDKFEIGNFKAGKFIFYVLVLGSLMCFLLFHKLLKNNIFKKHHIFQQFKIIEILIYFTPIIVIIYFDTKYSTFSLKNMICNLFPFIKEEQFKKINPYLNYILRIIGAYGIIQVLAQDFGVKTGEKQGDVMKIDMIQWLIFTGTAYSLTNNRSEAMLAATIYFILKFIISDGKTKPVCFDDV